MRDLSGNRFGRLIAVSLDRTKASKSGPLYWWLCCCDCGATKSVNDKHLISGKTVSCGCFRRDAAAARATVHGQANTPEWQVWAGMRARCFDPNNKRYARYGGRGILVCHEWRDDFAAFLSHVGKRPTPAHSIERIDNDRGYEPGNVRWATRSEQARNKSNSLRIKHNGQEMTAREYCSAVGLSYHTFQYRRLVLGWSMDRAMVAADAR